jgi:mannose-6-phosphate isomerase-like protein (cupin superfamily)
MIRRSEDKKVDRYDHKFGGEGYITVRSFIENDKEMNDKGRCFAHTTLNPGCEIGYHVHHGDTEIYYIFSGEAEYNDNGTMTTVKAGDVTFTPDGTGHGMKNTGAVPVEVIALIIYN